MRNLKVLLIVIVSLFIGVIPVFAESSKFEATINMEPEITENQINLILGFRGEEVMAISETITYDATRVTLLDIVSIDNFTVTESAELIDGKWHTITFLADSMYSFTDTNYAVVVFEVKDNYKIGKDSDIFLYNVEASGPDKTKYRYRGDYVSLNRESMSSMYMSIEPIKDGTKINYYLKKYLLVGIIFVIVVLAIVILIFINLPSLRKKENRTKEVNNSIRQDNYNSSSSVQPIKINQEEIEKLNENKKIINLSEAIVVSDVKPFEENPSKEDELEKREENKNIEVPFDPFNVKLEDMSAMNVKEIGEIPKKEGSEVTDNNTILVDELPAKKQDTQKVLENDLKEPIFTRDIVDEDVITLDDKDNNNHVNSNNNLNSILMILVISLIALFSMPAYALEGEEIIENPEMEPVINETINYRIDDLRDCIVGNIPFDSELDYNNDGKVDVLDIIYTRNTVNVNFEELLKTEPGFKELHGQSPNILGQSTPTTKVIVDKRKTTSRRTTIKKGNNKTTKATTPKKTTTEKTSRTTKEKTSRTTKEKTTKFTTTIDMPIDESITYQVNINASNGLVNGNSSLIVGSGKSATFIVVPNNGFEYDSVSCTNGGRATYSKTSRSLKVASVKNNITCTVNFVPRNDIKVSVNATNATANPKSAYVKYGESAQFTITPNKGHNYAGNLSCSNGATGSYNGTTLTVSNVNTDTTCSLSFSKAMYTIRVYVNNNLVDTRSVLYNETYRGEVTISNNKGTLKCNDSSVSASKSKLTDNLYLWAFSRKVTEDTNCYLNFS